ncbi:helix-turn-helix domain-containing protein [Nocardia asteroides]|uniref:helix-turn-helix domain-containing protein n=1 Tax=Nocardia asteroides TaxID=1824 RepID=UPI001E3D79F7|nr:helix-turn-helix domain-containing protein [Nocardia asteroides]UGT64699.1 helix-turn-helix domain-containing protein [Nocardia asteroides]
MARNRTFNVIAELAEADSDSAAVQLLTEFAEFHAALAHSAFGRTELILTMEAPDLTSATSRALAALAAWEVTSIQAMLTDDFDRMAEMTLPALMTVTDAATALGITRTRVQQLIDQGKLTARKVGSAWILLSASVAARDKHA